MITEILTIFFLLNFRVSVWFCTETRKMSSNIIAKTNWNFVVLWRKKTCDAFQEYLSKGKANPFSVLPATADPVSVTKRVNPFTVNASYSLSHSGVIFITQSYPGAEV